MKEKGGIVFYVTSNLERISRFYLDEVECTLWLDQGGCRIFQFGNMLFGFCERDGSDEKGALLTFFYENQSEVDRAYEKFKEAAENPPQENPTYRIYHFYAKDPDGRRIEFQHFLDPVTPY